MNTPAHKWQSRYPSTVAAGVLFMFLWLNLQHHAGAVQQLSVNVSGSISAYLKHRQSIEDTQGDASSWLAPLHSTKE
jgi:hypothetical protein